MFVVGIGSIGWMLALAAVMAAEKNLPWGRRLRTPVGVGAPRLGRRDRRRQRLSADRLTRLGSPGAVAAPSQRRSGALRPHFS